MENKLSSGMVLGACHKLGQGNCVRSLHELSKSARVGEGHMSSEIIQSVAFSMIIMMIFIISGRSFTILFGLHNSKSQLSCFHKTNNNNNNNISKDECNPPFCDSENQTNSSSSSSSSSSFLPSLSMEFKTPFS
jgi:hypothetical protein